MSDLFLRPDAALFRRFERLSTPEICDGMEPYCAMHYEVKPWVGERVLGPAFPVQLPMGSSDLVARAIERAREGDVLVLAAQGNCQGSVWGDFKSLCAQRRGLAGVVIDGAFRDLSGCRAVGFPVFARAVVCGSVQKTGYGAVNVPVSCAGAAVRPGDIIVGDENGVCVVPPEQAEEILNRAEEKARIQQEKIRQLLAQGI